LSYSAAKNIVMDAVMPQARKTQAASPSACPCGQARAYAECCGRLHAGMPAPDAEALMRSRYSAYVLGNAAYLLDTWHPDTRPNDLDLSTEPQPKWLGLEIKRHEHHDDHSIVEFVARYKVNGRAFRMRETSRFFRVDGRWFYVDGEVNP
jgi:SEC-C motif domain protein